jgi:hypothetical protein
MKTLFVLIVVLLFLLSGCNSYVTKVLKNKTQLEFKSNDLKLCAGADCKKYNCKPSSNNWKRAINIAGTQLNGGLLDIITNQYIMQVITKDRIVCHEIDIYNSPLNSIKKQAPGAISEKTKYAYDYLYDMGTSIQLTEAYKSKAIISAVYELKAQAELNDLKLTSSMISNFKSNLQKQIENNSNTACSLNFVIIELTGMGTNAIDTVRMKQKLGDLGFTDCLKYYEKGNVLVMGVAGFAISNFSTTQVIFEDVLMTNAIDASIKVENAEIAQKLEKIKIDASANWSKSVNEEIKNKLVVAGEDFFFPLWIKRVKKIGSYSE